MEQQIPNQVSSDADHKSLHIIYGIVIIVLIGVIAYFAIERGLKQTDNKTAQQNESFSVYQNDLDLYTVTYPSKWVIHAHTLNFVGDSFGRVTFSEMPFGEPLLELFSEDSYKVHTEKDWLNSFSLGAEIKEVSIEKVGNETFKHFIAVYGIDDSQEDYFIRERKIYSESNNPPITSFFGYSISSEITPAQKQQVLSVIQSFQTCCVYLPRD